MLKKSIAAALLLALMAWAEIALAPMLFMHGGHIDATREMSEHITAHHHVMPACHHLLPCCPGIDTANNAAPLEFTASNMPCQEDYRCCFWRGPQSVPAPVTEGRSISRDIVVAEIADFSPADEVSHAGLTMAVAPGPPPGQFEMVLRV